MKFVLRAVSRDGNGNATDIANSWPLNATTLSEAKAEADSQQWREAADVANAFEITDEAGRALTWRPFRREREDAEWS